MLWNRKQNARPPGLSVSDQHYFARVHPPSQEGGVGADATEPALAKDWLLGFVSVLSNPLSTALGTASPWLEATVDLLFFCHIASEP